MSVRYFLLYDLWIIHIRDVQKCIGSPLCGSTDQLYCLVKRRRQQIKARCVHEADLVEMSVVGCVDEANQCVHEAWGLERAVLNASTITSQKYEAVPRRACIQGSKICVSLNSRLERQKEEREGV